MSTKDENVKRKSGADLRAQAEARLNAMASPAAEAKRREASFLKNLSGARDDYQWIVANEAWTQLGHPTYTAWYIARVYPLLKALGARPELDIAHDVIDRARADEADLPAAQRRTREEIAELAGVSKKTVARRSQDLSGGTSSPGSDLEQVEGNGPSGTGPDSPEEPVPVHAHASGWAGGPGECGVECVCGVSFDGFDSIAEASVLLDGHIAEDSPAAKTDTSGVGSVQPQPGPDSSGAASVAPEAPAGPTPSDTAEVVPPVAIQPGVDHPSEAGEASKVDDAGAQPEGVTAVSDDPTSDPASEFMNVWRVFIGALESLDIDAVSPMLTDAEHAEMDADYPYIGKRLTALGVWQEAR